MLLNLAYAFSQESLEQPKSMVNLLSLLRQNTAEYFNQVLELSGFNLFNHVLCIEWFSILSVKIQNCSSWSSVSS